MNPNYYLILSAILSAGNSGMYASTRMLYNLALEGKAPRLFSRVSRSGVPRNALYATTLVGALCFLTSAFGDSTGAKLRWPSYSRIPPKP